MAGLASEPLLAIHPAELAKLGRSSGEQVRVRSARGDVVMTVVEDSSVDRHVVAARFTQSIDGDLDAAALVDASLLATDVRLENL
jgi:anaerobic selenocysteine-containing dehydrogenase